MPVKSEGFDLLGMLSRNITENFEFSTADPI